MSSALWDALAVAAKAVTYAATLGAAGGVFFLAYGRSLLRSADRLSIRGLVRMFMCVSVLASGARILITAGAMSGAASGLADTGLLRMVWQAGEGRAFIVRTAGLLLAAPAAMVDRRPAVWALLGAAAAATSFASIGHVHAMSSGWPILLVGVHLLGVAFWLGALGPLLLLARHDDPRRVAAPAARFGRAAAAAVSALILCGACLLWLMIGHVSELWNSDYGRTAAVKLGFVACLLGCAAFNKLRLTPRLEAGDAAAARSLRKSIRAEIALAALILSITASMTTLTGPPAPGSGPQQRSD